MSRKVILDPMDPVANELHQMVLDDPVARRAFFQQRALRSLGEAMRAAREDAGMTQTQLAESAGMTQAEISRIENALPVEGVTLATMVNLSNALNFRIAFEFENLPPAANVLQPAEEQVAHLAVREIT